MAETIEFYFDFSSPYGYLAAQGMDALAAEVGCTAVWKPFLLGALFKETGSQPLLHIPLKGEYARVDLIRTARRLGVPYVLPDPFPFMSVAACRAYYAIVDEQPAAAVALAKAFFHRAFGEGGDIGRPEQVLEVVEAQGLDREAMAAKLADPEVKDRLRREVDRVIALGIFGSPFFIYGEERFWGHDRMADLAAWIREGGW